MLKLECDYRQQDWYIDACKETLARKEVPDSIMDDQAQQRAIHDSGFALSEESINTYRRIVVDLSIKEREPYFFLAANDKYFRPWAKPVGNKLDMPLYTREKIGENPNDYKTS